MVGMVGIAASVQIRRIGTGIGPIVSPTRATRLETIPEIVPEILPHTIAPDLVCLPRRTGQKSQLETQPIALNAAGIRRPPRRNCKRHDQVETVLSDHEPLRQLEER